jgi:predicted transcriptional regulator
MSKHRLTGLQLAILHELWARGEATVSDLWEALHEDRGLAPTTLATILSRLERRGVVVHRTQARQYVYRAVVTSEEVQHSMVNELTSTLFEGDVPALVSHLLAAQDISPGDLARIREMIDEAANAASAREADK